jgi:hypothetical protein
MVPDITDSESVSTQPKSGSSRKPSTYVFDQNGDTYLVLTTFKDQIFHWEKETIWLGQEGSELSSAKEKKKVKKKEKKAVTTQQPAALPEPAVSISMPPIATTDVPLAKPDDIPNEGETKAECVDFETIISGQKPLVQDLDLGEKSYARSGKVKIRLLVSGRHLALASSYFEKMFSGPFAESKIDDSGLRRVTANEWDPEAFSIILTIIHGYHRDVPKSLTVEMLAKVAMIVDYYECHEIVELHANIWITSLKLVLPTVYGRDCILCMMISWVFSEPEIFQQMTQLALRHSGKLIEAQDIPLPADLLDHIDAARRDSLTIISSAISTLRASLTANTDCSYECCSILLGTLEKQHALSFLCSVFYRKEFPTWSIERAKTHIQDIRVPDWYNARGGRYVKHTCTIQQKLLPALENVEKELRVFNLQDFQFDKNNTHA